MAINSRIINKNIEINHKKLTIGAATKQKWRFKLDFEKEEVIIDSRVTRSLRKKG